MALKVKKPTEAQFTRTVLKLAKLKGWRTAHFRPARTKTGWRTAAQGDGVGFPDLILVRGGRIIFAELKRDEKSVISPEQHKWIGTLMDCMCSGSPIGVFIWNQNDMDQIMEVLA